MDIFYAHALLRRYEARKKHNARHLLRSAVIRGDVKKLNCEICGGKDVEGHHPDYSEPLMVVWLCRKHHVELHKGHKRSVLPEPVPEGFNEKDLQ